MADKELLSDKEIEEVTARALKDNPHWELDAWGLFGEVAKAQHAKDKARHQEEIREIFAER